jgi:hypothetical protein
MAGRQYGRLQPGVRPEGAVKQCPYCDRAMRACAIPRHINFRHRAEHGKKLLKQLDECIRLERERRHNNREG